MIPTATADKILAAKKCGDLFSKADKATVVLEYRKLAKEFHPDVCPLPNAEDVFKHLSKLYEEALDLLAQGQWEISNVVSIRDNCGKTYQGRYLKTFQFELGVAYVADLSVTYILDKQNKRFFDNAINQIGALKYANPNMEEEFSRYLPKIKHRFETRDGQYCLILDKTPDVFLLSDILAYYKNSIPDRHAAWIISRLSRYFALSFRRRKVHGEPYMTKQEKIVVSAYTGVLMCDLDALQNYIQDKLGWPVWTHELPSKEVLEEIREKSKDDFISICLSNGNDLISRSALLKEIGDPDDGMVLPAKHGIIDLVKRAPAM